MSSVIVISDDEQDELNVVHRPNLSSPIPPQRFLGNAGSSPGERKAKVNLKLTPPGQKKRRRLSDSDVESVEVKDVSKAKKVKREQRKAVSIPPISSWAWWWRRVLINPLPLTFSSPTLAYYRNQLAEGPGLSGSAQMALPPQISLHSAGRGEESLLRESGNGDQGPRPGKEAHR